MILNQRHTGLVVRDLNRSISFYEGLGLKVWRREEEAGPFIDDVVGISDVRIEWAKMKCPDGSLVELLQYHSHPDIQPLADAPSNRSGCSHIAFTVNNIARTCGELVKLGGTVVNPPAIAPSGLVRVAYCHDPDGILMEVVEEISPYG
ncbi:MAG: VOC family protein [Methylococcaceae bacterium]|jgi:catechol 2,3-dioxygenase-like lactoylglutathione lyase family enzyme